MLSRPHLLVIFGSMKAPVVQRAADFFKMFRGPVRAMRAECRPGERLGISPCEHAASLAALTG
jgi:hypothetical protein